MESARAAAGVAFQEAVLQDPVALGRGEDDGALVQATDTSTGTGEGGSDMSGARLLVQLQAGVERAARRGDPEDPMLVQAVAGSIARGEKARTSGGGLGIDNDNNLEREGGNRDRLR